MVAERIVDLLELLQIDQHDCEGQTSGSDGLGLRSGARARSAVLAQILEDDAEL
jgi:hypothetical protein